HRRLHAIKARAYQLPRGLPAIRESGWNDAPQPATGTLEDTTTVVHEDGRSVHDHRPAIHPPQYLLPPATAHKRVTGCGNRQHQDAYEHEERRGEGLEDLGKLHGSELHVRDLEQYEE